jgi:hypothetical protein
MGTHSRMEFSSRRAAVDFVSKKQAEELEKQAAGLRCFSMTHAPNFMHPPTVIKRDASKAEERGRKKHRRVGGRSKTSSSVSSAGSVSSESSRSRSRPTFNRQNSGDSRLTEGKISTHNQMMEKGDVSNSGATRMKLAKSKKRPSFSSQASSEPVCAVEALNQGEDGSSMDEHNLSPQELKELKRERKALARQAQKRAATLSKELREKEKVRVKSTPPGWSLPALREIALVGCKNFSVKGLNRLVANTPQLRCLDATDCRHLVPRVGKKEDELNSMADEISPVAAAAAEKAGGGSAHGSVNGSVKSAGGSVLGSLKSFGGGSQFSHRKVKKKKVKVDWAALSATLPYCRPAPLHRGLVAAPDADALAWRDSYVERYARERERKEMGRDLCMQAFVFVSNRSFHTIVSVFAHLVPVNIGKH